MKKIKSKLGAIALLLTPVLAGCDQNLQLIGINQLSAAAGTLQEAFVAQLVGPIINGIFMPDPPGPEDPQQFEITIHVDDETGG